MQHKTVQQHPRLGMEVLQGCNLMQLTEQQVHQFKQSLWEHGVVVVRQQRLTALQLKEFAKKTFGNSTLGHRSKSLDPEIDPNLQSSGVAILGNPKGHTQEIVEKFAWQWHHDKDHLPKTEGLDMNALYVVMLYGVEIPLEGVDGQPHTTEFLDMVEAYHNLGQEHQQQLESMSMYHLSPIFSTDGSDIPRKMHPIVSTHKVTGHKGLYLGSDTSIPVGMESRTEEAKQFWQELFQSVLERTPVYAHVWQPGDIVFWDNSQVMHTGIPYDAKKYRRVALRVGVVDNTYI
ncbi:MAG: TauD/TfdA family dioxygenase [Iphinoe sp. HA4291-MV1]|jgi:taurine dioxygenase|nr:TauD/TfdA family dioxygenase [Iphinoe sp. HA4291-MV1]